jgi:ATP-binding cassette subfamily F protein uup
LNRVSSTVLGLDGAGHIGRFADYIQWEEWVAEQEEAARDGSGSRANLASSAQSASPAPAARKKLSYLEAREFSTIEQRVEESDARLAAARARLNQSEIATDAAALQQALAELDAAERDNDALYARWAELEEKAG